MALPRRNAVVTLVAAAMAGLAVLPGSPVAAVPLSPWPAAGRVPTGCDPAVTVAFPDSQHWTYTYTDSSTPTVISATIGAGSNTTTVIPPAGRAVFLQARVSNPCSGVQVVSAALRINGVPNMAEVLSPASADPFNTVWSVGGTFLPENAGVYRVYLARVGRRYDSVTIDQDFHYVTSTASSARAIVAGAWIAKDNYLLRQTTLSTSQSATRIRKGSTVKVSGVLTYATSAGYRADNGERVLAQVRVGTGRWVTKATLTAGSTGAVSFTFAPTRTSQVRFVHATVLSGRFTAAVTSAIRTVTVR